MFTIAKSAARCAFRSLLTAVAAAWVVVAIPGSASAQPTPPTIAINFDYEGDVITNVTTYKDKSGKIVRTVTTTAAIKKSTLSVEERAAVVRGVQGEYDEAFGPGTVTVAEGKVGKVVVVVDGTPLKGRGYGTYGSTVPGQPSVVFESTFTKDKFTRSELIIGIEETAAHEGLHNLGMKGHRGTAENPEKMTEGTTVPLDVRKKGGRKFSQQDVDDVRPFLSLNSPGQKSGFDPGDLGVYLGSTRVGPGFPDETSLEAYVTYLDVPDGVEFGYMSLGGDFIGSTSRDSTFSFFGVSGQDLAVRFADHLCRLSLGCGSFTLSDLNPDNPSVYRFADLVFASSGGEVHIQLDASIFRTTGGFTRDDPSVSIVPEPNAWILLIAGMGLAGSALRYARRRSVEARW